MQDFHVTDYFKDKAWSDLRLMPTPVARYGQEGSPVIYRALFAFEIGTDPEACAFLEVRQGKEGPEWFYAMGPLTCFSVKGTYKEERGVGPPTPQARREPQGPLLYRGQDALIGPGLQPESPRDG
jgi:hypothetical protein